MYGPGYCEFGGLTLVHQAARTCVELCIDCSGLRNGAPACCDGVSECRRGSMLLGGDIWPVGLSMKSRFWLGVAC